MTSVDPLTSFHPALRAWFAQRFPLGPTEAQALGWGPIAARREHTLIAAPTGSGKTLAAFLVAIDRCLKERRSPDQVPSTSVIYVSPLRALTVDIKENLETPLQEISEIARALGEEFAPIRVAVRNGDTTAAARAAMLRDRPEIVVTTPESLYLLVTARRGRELLANVDTVIVDEIHAIARDKRAAHLALSLERLDALVTSTGRDRPTRVGCSATQRPIEAIARLLVGAGEDRSTPEGRPLCTTVDVGHRREHDVATVLCGDELSAVTSIEQLGSVISSLAAAIREHRTTLVFVNTRKMSERVAHLLVEELGEEIVAAHHGSLSSARRLAIERRLRAGELAAVVATSSLELGIDVGPVELVCQLGSPRAIATFLQRVGRAEHRRDGIPKGRLYPLTRDELVECVALLGAVHEGLLDIVAIPIAPLDILAQQVVAECAARGEDGIGEEELFALVRKAAPYVDLDAASFEETLTLVTDGIETPRGRRGAHLHRDRVNHVLRPRRGALLTAATSGGAIPELADYRVIVEPDEVVVGTVHEDFAVEAMIGDVFLLGSTPWRVRRVVADTVRVVDAKGAAPTIPFWLGEAPARTNELADAVSRLRGIVRDALESSSVKAACATVAEWARIPAEHAAELVAYLATAHRELGTLPRKEELVIERFFDDIGGMQLVIHCPYGARVNRGLGLALRKRLCRTFDFELQAAANDDAIVLSLGPQQAFALEDVPRFLSTESLGDLLAQAVLPTPIFTSRWRWNLGRSLVSPRYRGARHVPVAIQRMEADDLMVAIFPALAACQENATGPIEIPDHLLVRQTLADCMTEAIDLVALGQLVTNLRSGAVRAHFVESTEPSVLCHEIVAGRPFTFLDDAPLEERRTNAITLRRGIPLEARDLSLLERAIVDEITAEVAPAPRDREELNDVLCTQVLMSPDPAFATFFDALVAERRAMSVTVSGVPGTSYWASVERRRLIEAAFPNAVFTPNLSSPELDNPITDRRDAIEVILRGHLEYCGPIRASDLAVRLAELSRTEIEAILDVLVAAGTVLRTSADEYCIRRIVARIHSRQRNRERERHPAVAARDLMRFLLDWQHVSPQRRLRGIEGLAQVIGQLQGVEAAIGSWEESILPARIVGYQAHLLDELCARGETSWARLTLRASDDQEGERRSGSTPSRATPVALCRREDLAWLVASARGNEVAASPTTGAAAEVLEALSARGALFFSDLCAHTGRLPIDVADALWDGVARGLVTADSFQAVRALLAGRYRHATTPRHSAGRALNARRGGLLRRPSSPRNISPALSGGRWSILEAPGANDFEPDELAESVAAQLLERWGIVFRDIAVREPLALSWREVLFALRRFEARGVVRGGYFVAGFSGEQFVLPEALISLRATAARPFDGGIVRIAATDPLNLTGSVIAGPRIAAVRGRSVEFVDGIPVSADPARTEERPGALALH